MSKIESRFKEGNPIFETKISGISLLKLKKFCGATNSSLSDYFENGTHYVPGVYLIAMFRYIVKKIYKENNGFPMTKISSFYGYNGGTKESRVFINEDLTYKFQIFTKDPDGDGEKIVFGVEVCRTRTDIVLSGIFSFVK